MLLAASALGGWALGRLAGEQVVRGEDLFQTEPAAELSEAAQFSTFVGASLAVAMTVEGVRVALKEYGWVNVGLGSAAFVALVAVGRKLRE